MVFPQLFSIRLWQLNQDQWAVICQWRAVIKPSQVAFCCQLHHRCHELKYPTEWIFLTELTQCCSAAWIKPNFHILNMKGCKQGLIYSCHEKAVVERTEIGSRARERMWGITFPLLPLLGDQEVSQQQLLCLGFPLFLFHFLLFPFFSLFSLCPFNIYIILCYALAASDMCSPGLQWGKIGTRTTDISTLKQFCHC